MVYYIGNEVRDKLTGAIGVITDKIYSEVMTEAICIIDVDGSNETFLRKESELEPYKRSKEFKVETEIADNIVIGIIYEIDGDLKTEVCRGHGRIIHDGAEGIAQACSYAYKKAFASIDSGIYYKQRREQ